MQCVSILFQPIGSGVAEYHLVVHTGAKGRPLKDVRSNVFLKLVKLSIPDLKEMGDGLQLVTSSAELAAKAMNEVNQELMNLGSNLPVLNDGLKTMADNLGKVDEAAERAKKA